MRNPSRGVIVHENKRRISSAVKQQIGRTRIATRRESVPTFNELRWSKPMTQEFHPGQTVPESGVYRVSHDPIHPDMPHEVTVIKGRRFPTCRGCKGISFELVHAAKHIDEVDQLAEPDMAGAGHR